MEERCPVCKSRIIENNGVKQCPRIKEHELRENKKAIFEDFPALGNMLHHYLGVRPPGHFNPFRRIHCPYCNAQFHPSECAIYATTKPEGKNDQAEKGESEGKLLHRAPQKGLQSLVAHLWVKSLNGPAYTEDRASRQCPTCKKCLPYGFETETCINIAFVGDSASGKTHYLTALLHQLKTGELAQQGDVHVSFVPLNGQTAQKFGENDTKLFNMHEALDGTKWDELNIIKDGLMKLEPLIFKLKIEYKVQKRLVSSIVHLVFYDVPGERIAHLHTSIQPGWPILEAQAIILFADPLRMDRVSEAIVENDPQNQQAPESRAAFSENPKPHEILDTMIHVFTNFKKVNNREEMKIPLAIMLPKSDVLDGLAQKYGFENACFLHDAVYNSTLNVDSFAPLDKDVRQFLTQFKEPQLLSASIPFVNSSFFAVSATGCAPDSNGKFADVKPRRCLDPFLWILLKLSESDK